MVQDRQSPFQRLNGWTMLRFMRECHFSRLPTYSDPEWNWHSIKLIRSPLLISCHSWEISQKGLGGYRRKLHR